MIFISITFKIKTFVGDSLVVQWLELSTFMAMAQVQSLVQELESCKQYGVTKNK